MSQKDSRIDAYIEKAAGFAQPILNHLRSLVHQACPAAQETIKWGMPAFEHHGILCIMAAFKQHATFTLWKGRLVLGKSSKDGAMGQFGRLASLKDLPPDKVLLDYLCKAARLNEAAKKAPAKPRPKRSVRPPLAVPDFLLAALEKNRRARANFSEFTNSHKREYIQWLTEAKREETRQKRLQTALAWIADGKPQNWKYQRC